MSDQGGTPEAGWHPDPHGRHEYRYWDGQAWTDQVSDGGVVGSDPPGEAPTEVSQPVAGPPTGQTPAGPPSADAGYVPPTTDGKRGGKIPVGVLVLVGVVVALIAVAAGFLLLGGDDDGGGSLSGTISEDEPFVVKEVDLDAGEALRVIVEPSEDLDARLTLGIPLDVATTEAIGSLAGEGAIDEDEVLEVYGSDFGDLFSDDAVGDDLSSDLSSALDDDDFGEFQDVLSEELPALTEIGVPFGTANLNDEGEPEGGVFVAPFAGTYTVAVSGAGGTEGDFDGSIETEGATDDFEEVDEDDPMDIVDFLGPWAEHREFFCDEDFWGDDPEDVSESAGQVCDEDSFDELLSSDQSSDFSSDFSDDFSDFSDDFSSDFSDDFSDFSDDFSDDVSLGEPVDPAVFITEYGTDPTFDGLADSCFDGDLADCDQLYATTPIDDDSSYEGYGATCGGRLPEERPGQCVLLGG